MYEVIKIAYEAHAESTGDYSMESAERFISKLAKELNLSSEKEADVNQQFRSWRQDNQEKNVINPFGDNSNKPQPKAPVESPFKSEKDEFKPQPKTMSKIYTRSVPITNKVKFLEVTNNLKDALGRFDGVEDVITSLEGLKENISLEGGKYLIPKDTINDLITNVLNSQLEPDKKLNIVSYILPTQEEIEACFVGYKGEPNVNGYKILDKLMSDYRDSLTTFINTLKFKAAKPGEKIDLKRLNKMNYSMSRKASVASVLRKIAMRLLGK